MLRRQAIVERIARVLKASNRGDGFRVVHFSVQEDHVHLLVEARDAATLASRMTGLVTWVARRVNAILGRTGRFWADRYHRRDLRTPREVRHALVYVLANRRKHVLQRTGHDPGGVDPFSSAVFVPDAWEARARPWLALVGDCAPRVHGEPPVAAPRTWLAREGWRRHGLLRVDDVPAPTRAPSLSREGLRSPTSG